MKTRRRNPDPIMVIARDEVRRWNQSKLPEGLVLAIIFCFAHRLITGQTFEESFCKSQPVDQPDYQI